MGTHADFYVKTDKDWEWLGGINWDGQPDNIDHRVLNATSVDEFKTAIKNFFDGRSDVSHPENGWDRPWKDSMTTDYTYIFEETDSVVYISEWGGFLHTLTEQEGYTGYCQQCDKDNEHPMDLEEYIDELGFSEKPDFPDMKKK